MQIWLCKVHPAKSQYDIRQNLGRDIEIRGNYLECHRRICVGKLRFAKNFHFSRPRRRNVVCTDKRHNNLLNLISSRYEIVGERMCTYTYVLIHVHLQIVFLSSNRRYSAITRHFFPLCSVFITGLFKL